MALDIIYINAPVLIEIIAMQMAVLYQFTGYHISTQVQMSSVVYCF